MRDQKWRMKEYMISGVEELMDERENQNGHSGNEFDTGHRK